MVRERDVKKEWIRPLTTVQKFEANEYVAACGDSGVVYNFVCDAGSRWELQSVYIENNGLDGLQTERTWENGRWYKADSRRTWSYHACGATHEAESNDEFLKGYVVNERDTIPVIIWTDHGTNTHCTTKLNMDEWETAKS